MDIKYVGVDRDDLKSGESYAVEGFTGGVVILLSEEAKFVQVPFLELNNQELWDLSQEKHKKKAPDKKPPHKGHK